jgi:hypothetical protein
VRTVALIVITAVLVLAALAARLGPAWVPLTVVVASIALSAVPSTLSRSVAVALLVIMVFQVLQMQREDAPPLVPQLFDPSGAMVLVLAALAAAVCSGADVLSYRPHTMAAVGAATFFLHPIADTYAFTYAPLPALQAMVLVAMLAALVGWRRLRPRRISNALLALAEPFVVLLAGWLLAVVFLKERQYAPGWLWYGIVLPIAVPATLPAALKLIFAAIFDRRRPVTLPRSDPPPPPR